MSQAFIPLLFLHFDISCTITHLLQSETCIVKSSPVQVVFRDPTEVGRILDVVVSVDLLLIAWHVKEVRHLATVLFLLCEGIFMQLFLECT